MFDPRCLAVLLLAVLLSGGESQPPAPPPYAPPSDRAPITDAAQHFRIRSVDGRWWLVDPSGRPLWLNGINGPQARGFPDGKGAYPYDALVKSSFADLDAWAEDAGAKLRSWGFNSTVTNHMGGDAARAAVRSLPLLTMHNMMFGELFWRAGGKADALFTHGWQSLPNMFAPGWEAWCDERAREQAGWFADHPWTIGFLIDNERDWGGRSGLARSVMRRPSEDPAKRVLVALARKRYGEDITAFNAGWGTTHADWTAMAAATDPAAPRDAQADALCLDMVEAAAERFFSVTAAAIRRHAPGKLVLGARQHRHRDVEPLWRAMGRHCDAITINDYPDIDPVTGLYQETLDAWERIHAWSGRPLIISEWSFQGLDSGIPCTRGAGMRLDTQAERANCFRLFQETAASLPYVLGTQWFAWVDQPADGSFEDGNYGLIRIDGTPWPELTATAAEVNARTEAIHARGAPRHVASAIGQPWSMELPQTPAPPPPWSAGGLTVTPTSGGMALALGEVRLGRLGFMVQQQSDRDRWNAGSMRVVSAWQDDAWLAIDVEFASGAAPASPVDQDADPAPRMRLEARFWLPRSPGSAAIISQELRLTNDDAASWRAVSVYHAFWTELGGEGADDRLLGRETVEDPAAGVGVSFVRLDGGPRGRWWRGSGNRWHPDMQRRIDRMLEPGESIGLTAPPGLHTAYRMADPGGRVAARAAARSLAPTTP